jgi:hypothetical protein
VRVVLRLESPGRRRIVWTANEKAGADGFARIRVLYPTDQPASAERVRAPGSYHVTSGTGTRTVGVTENDIESGRTLRLPAP